MTPRGSIRLSKMENNVLKNILIEELFYDETELLRAFSSSSSSSDEDEDVALKLISLIKNKRTCRQNFCEDAFANYSDGEFIRNFRVNKEVVNELAEQFGASDYYTNLIRSARANISPKKHLLVFLWFAGRQTSSYRDVANRFNLSLGSLFDIITRISSFLSHMASNVIKLPLQAEKGKTADYYSRKTGFPNVIGVIDCTHIKIDKPKYTDRPIDYYNTNEYYSMNVQGLCNESLNFIDIFIGYPGSVHDAEVFRNSPLFSNLEDVCGDSYIVGDSAYPLSPQIMVPYTDNGHLTAAQRHFNKKLSSCRVSIEHSFGLLKQRFRQLNHLKLKGHERLCDFIRACCVLHNIANKDDATLFHEEEKIADIQPENDEESDVESNASQIRNKICRELHVRKQNRL